MFQHLCMPTLMVSEGNVCVRMYIGHVIIEQILSVASLVLPEIEGIGAARLHDTVIYVRNVPLERRRVQWDTTTDTSRAKPGQKTRDNSTQDLPDSTTIVASTSARCQPHTMLPSSGNLC